MRYDDDFKGPIDLKVLDIPFIHTTNDQQNKTNLNYLYDELSNLTSTDIFEYGCIKALIEIKFQHIKRRIVAF